MHSQTASEISKANSKCKTGSWTKRMDLQRTVSQGDAKAHSVASVVRFRLTLLGRTLPIHAAQCLELVLHLELNVSNYAKYIIAGGIRKR